MHNPDLPAWSLVAALTGVVLGPYLPLATGPPPVAPSVPEYPGHEETADCSGDLRKIIDLQAALEWWRLLCFILGAVCASLFVLLAVLLVRLCCCSTPRNHYHSKVINNHGLPFSARPLAAFPALLNDGVGSRDHGTR